MKLHEIFIDAVFLGCLVISIYKGMQFLAFMCLLLLLISGAIKLNKSSKKKEKEDDSKD